MLTLSVIKENPEEVIRRLAIKHFDGKEAINRVLELDKIRRASQAELDGKLAELKVLAAQTGQLMKAGKKEEAEAPEILPALTAHHFRFRRQVGDKQHQDNTAQNAENRLFHLLAHEFHSSLMNGSQLALSLVNYLSSWL